MSYARDDALVSTEWLAAHLEDDGVVVVDASFHLPAAGRDAKAEFAEVRIPGARFFDVDDISDKSSDLPHMVPAPELFAEKVAALGISNGTRVIAYDVYGGPMAAMRAWWMFRLYGHDNAAVLEGGLPKWQAEGRPTESGPPAPPAPGQFTAGWRPEMVRSREHVLANIEGGAETVVDVRAAGRFAGTEPEPRAGMRSGHIPGSLNLPFGDLLDPAGHNAMRPAEDLQRVLADAGVGDKPVVTSCGSGVTACVGALALYLLGRDDVAVYDGSWSEWGGRDDTPIETGS